MTKKLRIFVSSVQKELAAERLALQKFIRRDPLHHRFFEVVLFEDFPASGRRADQVYLAEVDRCDVYLCLLGNEYGYEDGDGFSPTEREFDRATDAGKERLVFVKGKDDTARHPKVRALLNKVGAQCIRKRFPSTDKLTAGLSASLVEYLECRGIIQGRPFDERACHGVTIADIDTDAVAAFVRRARAERQFPLPENTPTAEVLAHLQLLCNNQPTNAAVLLFGKNPQQFVACAEVRCMHFHGTEIERPAPFYRIFKGRLFDQVDQATDFVLSKLNQSVGTRDTSARAPVINEVPAAVVQEAIVNAIAHRDYASTGAVQISVFADRFEVWNPGTLLPPLTPERLREPHPSLARNHRICEVLFLARYIEKYGTGTLLMIRESVKHSLPEPNFVQRSGEFVTTVWRDWLTETVVAKMGLNDRQQKALLFIKKKGQVTNAEYQSATGAIRKTSTRDLGDFVKRGVLQRIGTGKAAHYVFAKQRDIYGTYGTSGSGRKPDMTGTNPTASGKMPAKKSRHKTDKAKSVGRKRLKKGSSGSSKRRR